MGGRLYIGYQMKMQLRKILKLPTVDDQTIGRESKFIYKMLNSRV